MLVAGSGMVCSAECSLHSDLVAWHAGSDGSVKAEAVLRCIEVH